MPLGIDSKTRKIFLRRLSKVNSSKLPEYYPNRQTLELVQRAQQAKHCENNDRDEDISPNVYNKDTDKSSSKKVRQKYEIFPF